MKSIKKSDFAKLLIEEAKKLNPDIRIGKAGLTEGMINEIKLQLKVKKLVKVKMLKPAFEEIGKKKLAMEIAEKTGGEIVQQVGFVVVLWRR